MSLQTIVLPLGFGLSAVLSLAVPGSGDEGRTAERRPPRVYTNEDLDRVHPFRDQTGVASVPAPASDEDRTPAGPRARSGTGSRNRGPEYWRREAEKTRGKLRALDAQADALRARIAEREANERRFPDNGRRRVTTGEGKASLQARLAGLERRMRELEDDLAERARREGALPGWLR